MIYISALIISSYLIFEGKSTQPTPDPSRYQFGTIPHFVGGGVGFVYNRTDIPTGEPSINATVAPTTQRQVARFTTPDPARYQFGTIPYFLGGGIGFVHEIPSETTVTPTGTDRHTTIAV